MQTFQTSGLSVQGPKNYVFVDEHNRHKRLKVMRACEGCRRRKIKCDAATTNSWPCAACKRLKLTCVPPMGGADGDPNNIGADDQYISQVSGPSAQHYPLDQYQYLQTYGSQPDLHQNYQTYDLHNPHQMYQQQEYQYSTIQHDPDRLSAPHPNFHQQQRLSSFDSANGNIATQSVGSPQSTESVTAEGLAENLGELRIGDSGVAPYIRQQNAASNEAPAPILDDDDDLPPLPTSAGSQIRIPPALMPNEEEAATAFRDFFRNVHPYVPVLVRSNFYHQWQNDRNSISPLLLEAILACAGQVSDDPAGGSQWLALANRHEEHFADTPRLSTIQALLLLLKAREKSPKKGYYYRSWILVKKIVAMAKDLDLHEHYDTHEAGERCGSSSVECLAKTRIWQLAMMCELVVGGPQGRYDFGIDIETVDLSPAPPHVDIDDYEKMISRQFGYWVRNVHNIRGVTEAYHKLKRKNKEWGSDPKFVAYNENFRKWPAEVPPDLKIPIPVDGSLPPLQSHFLANMHCHYQLGIVMLYKPQLSASKDFAYDEKWKHIMSLLYSSAKKICVLQEATLEQYDVLGLACMLRGLSFPIYAILSCVMLHLVAITSPDPDFNRDAREYFVRHMRVLERCIAEWPMPEVEAQINSLRLAFSANVDKPFDLKPSFPYGTPSEKSGSPEVRRASEPQQQVNPAQDQQFYQQSLPHSSYFPTPPISAGHSTNPQTPQYYGEFQGERPNQQFPHGPATSNPNNAITPTEPWNPTPIIDSFNTAFVIPPSALAPPPASSYSSSPVSMPHQNLNLQLQTQQYGPGPTSAGPYNLNPYAPSLTSQPIANHQTFMSPNSQTTPQPQMTPSHYPQQGVNSYFNPSMNQRSGDSYGNSNPSFNSVTEPPGPNNPVYVTPKEWQQSVASVFDPNGLKRKWDYDQQHMGMPQQRHGSG